MSDVDNTASKASDVQGGDSWADSEEDSEMGAPHGKKVKLPLEIFHIDETDTKLISAL